MMKQTETFRKKADELYTSLAPQSDLQREFASAMYGLLLELKQKPHSGQFYRIDLGKHWYRLVSPRIIGNGQPLRFSIFYEKTNSGGNQVEATLVWIRIEQEV